MIVGGIDPGLKGAIAIWDGDHLTLLEIPTTAAASRGRDVDWAALAFNMDLMLGNCEHMFIERVGARPGQGTSSMFKFGYVAGGLRGIIACLAIPVTMVTPQAWKKAMGVGQSKEGAVARASELFPQEATSFRGPKGGIKDGVAEAALIARYGRDKLVKA